MRSTVQGPVEGALFCSAWLYVLSCFQYGEQESIREDPSGMAVRLGEDYMKGVADKVKTLLLRISEVPHLLLKPGQEPSSATACGVSHVCISDADDCMPYVIECLYRPFSTRFDHLLDAQMLLIAL